MGTPVSIRLDDDIQAMLETAARARGIGLATYVREIATAEAKRVRKERIREQTKAVAAYVASNKEAQEFFEDLGHADEHHRQAMNGRFAAGDIVLADWRDALPKEPNKRRPAIVVEEDGLFDADYPNLLLVPLAEDAEPRRARPFRPDRTLGFEWLHQALLRPASACDHHLEAADPPHRVPDHAAELAAIRDRIAIALGLA